jgi:hypothetical protein
MTEARLMAELAAGEPPIIPRRTRLGLMFDPMTLEPGEEAVVAGQLRSLLA